MPRGSYVVLLFVVASLTHPNFYHELNKNQSQLIIQK